MYLIDNIEKAWISGYSAYHNRRSLTENPYEEMEDKFFEWREGWLSAQDIEHSFQSYKGV